RLQIIDQGGESLIEFGAVVAHQTEVVAVAVPAAVGQGDDANAGLDETARHQQVIVAGRGAVVLELVRLAVAVHRLDLLRLAADIEGLEQFAGGQHAEGAFVDRIHATQLPAGIDLTAKAVETGQQTATVADALQRGALEHEVVHALPVGLE